MTTLLALAILIFIGMIVAGTVHRVLLHLEEKRRRRRLQSANNYADIARELRNVLRNDPMKAERAIGYMYGYAFKMAESLYEMRGSRGRQVWR